MQEELLEMICCPACRYRLAVQVLEEDEVSAVLRGSFYGDKSGKRGRAKSKKAKKPAKKMAYVAGLPKPAGCV